MDSYEKIKYIAKFKSLEEIVKITNSDLISKDFLLSWFKYKDKEIELYTYDNNTYIMRLTDTQLCFEKDCFEYIKPKETIEDIINKHLKNMKWKVNWDTYNLFSNKCYITYDIENTCWVKGTSNRFMIFGLNYMNEETADKIIEKLNKYNLRYE